MSSDKRDFSNFREFPGNLIDNTYVFPLINTTDTSGRNRTWKIFVRLISSKPDKTTIDWDTTLDEIVKISDAHFDNVKLPEGAIAQVWVEQGIVGGKQTRSIPTYIDSGKNLGKKNATTAFTQALINARSKYLKKMQESSSRENIERYFPMALHKYEDNPRDKSKHLTYPVAVQRKLDGGRAVAFYKKDHAVLYSRKLKDLEGNTHILEELNLLLLDITKKYPGIYLDGEIYRHGVSLADIAGAMKRDEGSKLTDIGLEYHVFDVFFPNKKNMPFVERNKILSDIFTIRHLKFIKPVETIIARDEKEETALYKKFLDEKYEGSIIRNLNSPYEFGIGKEIRTYYSRKRKPRYSDEYEIIGYTEGSQGKDKGAIIWILTTKANGKKKTKAIEFHSTPVGMNYEERYELFKTMTPDIFEKKYKGKMMTVEYDDISNDGVPLRAKAKNIRILP